MSKKVINLNQKNDYKESLEETLEFLEKTEKNLLTEIIDLAVLGKWKKWSDEQEIGTEFSFTDEMLNNTGDKNIDLLCELRGELSIIIDKITKTNKVG